MKTTTLNKIRSFGPCDKGWRRLLRSLDKTEADDEILTFGEIYKFNGLHDTIWCLRTLDNTDVSVTVARKAAEIAKRYTRAGAAAMLAARCATDYVDFADAADAADASDYADAAVDCATRAANTVNASVADEISEFLLKEVNK